MEIAPTPLVLTKIRLPAVRPRTILRQRLLERLSGEDGAGLALVCASAGYGKTTLLTGWAHALQHSGAAVAWYAIDPADDDPIPFGAYLVASLNQALGSHPALEQLGARLRAAPEPDLLRVLPEMINVLAGVELRCVLVMDDYHLIHAPAVHAALSFLLERMPENVRLVIGSRSEPPLALARLRAQGRLVELRPADLRFTRPEVDQFLQQTMDLRLPAEDIDVLETRTEGWIAGLQLAGLAIRAGGEGYRFQPGPLDSLGAGDRYLVDYLMEEVFDRQPPDVQEFLCRTSILERLCAPLCDALLADGAPPLHINSEDLLRRLEQANLFLLGLGENAAAPGPHPWYRYHHLFRAFLQARLAKTNPGLLPGLHRAAMDWLAGHGLLREAARHAFHGRDWPTAAAFVEKYSFSLILHSDIAAIYEWCAAFPEEVLQARPMLGILHALSLAYSFRQQNRARVEARLRQAARLLAPIQATEAARDLAEMAAVVRTFLAMTPDRQADPQALLADTAGMLTRYPPGDPGRFSGLLLSGYARMALLDLPEAVHDLEAARELAFTGRLYFGMVETTFHLARIAYHQGLLETSAQACRLGLEEIRAALPDPAFQLPALGSLEIALGCALLEQNRLPEAEQSLINGLEQVGAGANPHYVMTACLALFRLYATARPREAGQWLDRLDAIWPDLAFCTRGLRLLQALRGAPASPDLLAEARAWSRDFEAELAPANSRPAGAGIGPFGAADAYYQAGLSWAWVQIAVGNPQGALDYGERQAELAAHFGLRFRVIELSLVAAEAAACLEGSVLRSGRGGAALERARSAARDCGHVLASDQSPVLRQLLVQAAKQGGEAAGIRRILAPDGPPPAFSAGSEAGGLSAALTGRELDVLRLMAQGAANQDIAGQLVISLGTVKSHINHILHKLGARNRTEAVARARAAGIIS